MQENEFEKRIRELMGDFRMPPSETPWQNIVPRIQKKEERRRRYVLFLLFPALLLTGVAFFFLYPGFKQAVMPGTTVGHQGRKKTSDKPLQATVRHGGTSGSTHPVTGDNTIKAAPSKSLYAGGVSAPLPSLLPSHSSIIPPPVMVNELPSKINQDAAIAGDEQGSDSSSQEPVGVPAQDKNMTEVDDRHSLDSAVNSTAKKEQPKALQHGKTRFAIGLFYGRSDQLARFQDIVKSGPGTVNSGTISIMDTSGSVSTQSHNTVARQSFSAGIEVEKNISVHGNISAGVYYTRMETEIQTGPLMSGSPSFPGSGIPSTVNSFYLQGQDLRRRNRYSFLQVPVNYEYRFTRKGTLGLNGGASALFVLKSDGIVYDAHNDMYYDNSAVLRRMQVSLDAGVSIHLHPDRHTSLQLGPALEYGVNGMFRSGSYEQLHLVRYGFRAVVSFAK